LGLLIGGLAIRLTIAGLAIGLSIGGLTIDWRSLNWRSIEELGTAAGAFVQSQQD
jgi:hypothetical protein